MSGTDTAPEWLETYERVSFDIRNLTSEIREKESGPGGLAAKDRRVFGRRLTEQKGFVDQLEKSLSKMEMNPIAFRIGDGELIRRQALMTSLRTQSQTADDLLQGKGGARDQLLGSKRPKEFVDTDETRHLTNRDLLQHQQSMVERQDEHLDSILAGVTTLKTMSQDINQELDLHKSLLDDLGNAIDSTDTTIQASTTKVVDIQEKEQGCWPLMIIILLLVAIVVLMVV